VTTEPADDDSLLEVLDQTVDDVLARGMQMPEPEDRWERRQRLLDSWTAIILAVAAVATAWASFQASQWSGIESDAQATSAIQRSDANRAASEATSEQIVDSQMWLSWLNAYANNQDARATFFRERFSPQLSAAQDSWVAGAAFDADGQPVTIPAGTPMDLPAYTTPATVESQSLSEQAEAQLAEADVAAGNSTRFVMLAVLFAMVLFFASVATKFSTPRTQAGLILVSIMLLLVSLVWLILLPHTL
jgi:hypothetical protein